MPGRQGGSVRKLSGEMTTQIGKYQVQAELGRGGFGRVYRAYDPTVGRLVAIKTLAASDEPLSVDHLADWLAST